MLPRSVVLKVEELDTRYIYKDVSGIKAIYYLNYVGLHFYFKRLNKL